MSLWVIVESTGDGLRKVGLELLGRGRELGVVTTAVLLGGDVDEASAELTGRADALIVVQADAPLASDAAAAALARLASERRPGLVVAGTTAAGRDTLARAAALLGVGVAAGCTSLEQSDGAWVVRRPVQGGKAYAEQAAAGLAFATVRPNTFALPDAVGAAPAVELWTDPAGSTSAIESLAFEPSAGGRVPLQEAAVVVAGGRLHEHDVVAAVAGGRGVGAAEDFALVEQLADALGGAVGASRAVVDARWRPVEEQVGKSGRTVAPDLYFAVGISGAIHHTMGMDTSGVVVAINSDASALMFQHADYGLVGDSRQILPALIERLKG